MHSPFTRLTSLPHDFFLHVVCFSHSSTTAGLLAAFRLPSIGAYILFETHEVFHGEAHQILSSREECTNRSNLHRSKQFFFDGHTKNCPRASPTVLRTSPAKFELERAGSEPKLSTVHVAYSLIVRFPLPIVPQTSEA